MNRYIFLTAGALSFGATTSEAQVESQSTLVSVEFPGRSGSFMDWMREKALEDGGSYRANPHGLDLHNISEDQLTSFVYKIYKELKEHNTDLKKLKKGNILYIPSHLLTSYIPTDMYVITKQDIQKDTGDDALFVLQKVDEIASEEEIYDNEDIYIEGFEQEETQNHDVTSTHDTSENISHSDTYIKIEDITLQVKEEIQNTIKPILLYDELGKFLCNLDDVDTLEGQKRIEAERAITRKLNFNIEQIKEYLENQGYANIEKNIVKLLDPNLMTEKKGLRKNEKDDYGVDFVTGAGNALKPFDELRSHISHTLDDYKLINTRFDEIKGGKSKSGLITIQNKSNTLNKADLLKKSNERLHYIERKKSEVRELIELIAGLTTDLENKTSLFFETREEIVTERDDLQVQITGLIADKKQLYILLDEANECISNLETMRDSLQEAIYIKDTQLSTNKEIIDQLLQKNQTLAQDICNLQGNLEYSQEETQDLQDTHKTLLSGFLHLERAYNTQLSALRPDQEKSLQNENQVLEAIIKDLECTIKEYTQTINSLHAQQQSQTTQTKKDKETIKIAQLNKKVEDLTTKLATAQSNLNSQSAELEKTYNKLQKKGLELIQSEKEKMQLSQQIKQILEDNKAHPESAINIITQVSKIYPKNPAKTIAKAIEKGEMSPMFDVIDAPRCTGEYMEKRGKKRHHGYDIPGPIGKKIKASSPGVTSKNAFQDGKAGNYLNTIYIVKDSKTAMFILKKFMHLDQKSTLEPGTAFEEGDVLGVIGTTGGSTGPHLHYEIYYSTDGVHRRRANPTEEGKLYIKKAPNKK